MIEYYNKAIARDSALWSIALDEGNKPEQLRLEKEVKTYTNEIKRINER